MRSLAPFAFVFLLVACGDDSGSSSGGSGGSAASTATGSTSTVTGSTSTSTAPTSSSSDGSGAAGGGSAESTGASSASGGSGPGSTGTATGSGGGSSLGCGNAAAQTGETFRHLTIQGTDRTFIVDAPEAVDPERPLSVVFVFHGNGGTGQGIQAMGIQNVPGAREQAIFVFPDGLPFQGFGVGWNGACDDYDMELFDTIVEDLSAEYCVDPARVFAAGFSWGGDMCESLACCRGEAVRAIAPASGPEFYPPGECLDTARPAFRMTYATNDAYAPELFADAIEFYRLAHGCQETFTATDPAPCIAYDGCDEPVIACEYEGMGHAWPADWAERTWAFFSQLP